MASRPGNMPPKLGRRCISLASARLHRRRGGGRRRYLGDGATTPVLSGVMAPSPPFYPAPTEAVPYRAGKHQQAGQSQGVGASGVPRVFARWARPQRPAYRQATRRGTLAAAIAAAAIAIVLSLLWLALPWPSAELPRGPRRHAGPETAARTPRATSPASHQPREPPIPRATSPASQEPREPPAPRATNPASHQPREPPIPRATSPASHQSREPPAPRGAGRWSSARTRDAPLVHKIDLDYQ